MSKEIVQSCTVLFYLYPLIISLFYFTAIKVDDRDDNVYNENTLSFIQVVVLCFIPILNMVFMLFIATRCIKSIIELFTKEMNNHKRNF